MIKQITEKRLFNIALLYLTRFESSEQKLRQMLLHRIRKQAVNEAEQFPCVNQWIENVVRQMVSLGYVNNERYAETQIRVLCQQGRSEAFIRKKLARDGISVSILNRFLKANDMLSEVDRAVLWLKRQRKGGYRSATDNKAVPKDLAALGRQGFSYAVANKALEKSYKDTHQTFDEAALPDEI